MPVVIGEVVTEVVVAADDGARPGAGGSAGAAGLAAEDLERVVRIVTERVVERLRREWEA